MTRSQQYLIGAIVALFGVVIFIFRADMFVVENRPGVTAMLQNVVQPYGLTVFVLLFAYLLSKSFGLKWWVFMLVFVLIELTYVSVLHFSPRFLSPGVKYSKWFGHFRAVALDNRSMVQFQDQTAKYDTELFYTLKPGNSSFKSYEFNTKYAVNSLGVRDDEESLNMPEVLFLGDSFTMGWGVEEQECFPAVFEKSAGLKTLNSGISSYGTAREFRIMARTKTDSLKAVIIQYHDTDLEENNFFIKNGKLGSRTAEDFEAQVKANDKVKKYFPFKYIKLGAIAFVTSLQQKSEGAASSTEAALSGVFETYPNYLNEFYQILSKIKEIKDVPVIVTYTGSFYTDSKVMEHFEEYATKNNIEGVYFVNLAPLLNEEDYFYFDDHLNAKGHLKVAKALEEKYKTIIK